MSLKHLTPETLQTLVPPLYTSTNSLEAIRNQAQIIYIRESVRGTKLKDTTVRITEGADMSMLTEEDCSYPPLFACIILMDYEYAVEYMKKITREVDRPRKSTL